MPAAAASQGGWCKGGGTRRGCLQVWSIECYSPPQHKQRGVAPPTAAVTSCPTRKVVVEELVALDVARPQLQVLPRAPCVRQRRCQLALRQAAVAAVVVVGVGGGFGGQEGAGAQVKEEKLAAAGAKGEQVLCELHAAHALVLVGGRHSRQLGGPPWGRRRGWGGERVQQGGGLGAC
jgi:hypothetical protein